MSPSLLVVPGALFLLGLFLGLLEVALRRLDWPRFAPRFNRWTFLAYHPPLGWRNVPGYEDHGLSVNARGFRGPLPQRPKPPGVLRIVCLGDSSTFGIWQEGLGLNIRYDSYPGELARRLEQAEGPPVEVINAGVLGYSSCHGLRQLVLEIVDLEPDIVTVRFGFNDHSPAWDASLRAREPSARWARDLLYRLCRVRLFHLLLAVFHKLAFWLPGFLEVPWADRQTYARNLERMTEIAAVHGFRLLFLDYPIRAVERGESKGVETPWGLLGVSTLPELHHLHGEYGDVLEEVAQRRGVPLLETAGVFVRRDAEVFGDYDMVHPNDRGAAALAELLQAKLEELGWLEGPG